MQQYLQLCQKALNGFWRENRNGRTVGYLHDMAQYEMDDGFPVVTTKKLALRTVIHEMLGFLRGFDSAAQFRELGVPVWDQDANHNSAWLANPHRQGDDDLGRIYGVQARGWEGPVEEVQATPCEGNPDRTELTLIATRVDQLAEVVENLKDGIDNRRLIVNHWNPGELDRMALPPCHVLYKFALEPLPNGKHKLHLSMYQRSCDLPLGVPFNIAGYAWLLHVIARVTGHTPGRLTHFMDDIHIYENQIQTMQEVQLKRDPRPLPTLWMDPKIQTLEDLETWVTADHFRLEGYDPHPAVKYPLSVG